ncbi:MAG TPA: RES family NAD+ phosphorylase [Bryobacteraceae bacterium]|jgi:RES domain-containing protein
MAVIRLHGRQRAASNYDGSLLYPGRWNPVGTPMLYASTSLSLACLEILVHLSPRQTPVSYVYSKGNFEALSGVEAEYLAVTDFRGDLRDVDSTRRAGRGWAMQRQSLGLLVPSVIIPTEMNVLLNPLHPAFEALTWGNPEPFEFDSRLVKT